MLISDPTNLEYIHPSRFERRLNHFRYSQPDHCFGRLGTLERESGIERHKVKSCFCIGARLLTAAVKRFGEEVDRFQLYVLIVAEGMRGEKRRE